MLSSLLKFPLVFISGVLLPLEQIPYPVKLVSLLSPLTYTTDLFRHAIYSGGVLQVAGASGVLTVYTLAFAALSVKLHERSMPKRLW